MFAEETQDNGRMWASTLASTALYAGIAAAVLILGKAAPQVLQAPLEVVFRATAAPASPPPPARAAPAQKKPSTPKPALALVAPKEVSSQKLNEAAPTPVEVESAPAQAEPTGGMHAAPAPAAPAKPTSRDPIQLPENGTPPVASADNAQPEYPDAARSQGLEGQVILKIVVDARGNVTRVDVMKGEEPFVSAAVAAVKRWTYSPALVDGSPTSVFRIVKIPFRLRG